MRPLVVCLVLACALTGCRTAEPSNRVEPTSSAPVTAEAGQPPVATAAKTIPGAAPAPAKPDAAHDGVNPPAPQQRAPQGYVLAYPGSARTSAQDQTTEGNGERNRIVLRTSPDSMDTIAAFYLSKLELQETLSLTDRKILTGPLPDGGRIAITLTRSKGDATTLIEVVAVTKA